MGKVLGKTPIPYFLLFPLIDFSSPPFNFLGMPLNKRFSAKNKGIARFPEQSPCHHLVIRMGIGGVVGLLGGMGDWERGGERNGES